MKNLRLCSILLQADPVDCSEGIITKVQKGEPVMDVFNMNIPTLQSVGKRKNRPDRTSVW